ncbi:hypothetical protein TrRE_jg1045 [Triparma retinervis]|uniref:BspA family leucine-rich repeat surface protein n=1 Tax=Triparma retinervis TaxID=2557542 RepID=A0A9W6ZS74_9STRA|nr:hypothetical protein TrRE_jg1045 [Triparma retinervis]
MLGQKAALINVVETRSCHYELAVTVRDYAKGKGGGRRRSGRRSLFVDMQFPLLPTLSTAVLLLTTSKFLLVEGCTTTNSVNTNCEVLTNTNFQEAIDLWVSNPTSATDRFGHISLWETSGITKTQNAFLNKDTFNDDISGWDVSSVTNMKRMFR